MQRALGTLLDGVAVPGALSSGLRALRIEDVLERNGVVLFSLDIADYPRRREHARRSGLADSAKAHAAPQPPECPPELLDRMGEDVRTKVERRWASIRRELGPCLVWRDGEATIKGAGGLYGRLYDPDLKRSDASHLVVWRRCYPDIPISAGWTVDHLCYATLCQRPDHLQTSFRDSNALPKTGRCSRKKYRLGYKRDVVRDSRGEPIIRRNGRVNIVYVKDLSWAETMEALRRELKTLLAKLDREKARLQSQLEAEEEAVLLSEESRRRISALADNPLAFDDVRTDLQKAAILRLLLADVTIRTNGLRGKAHKFLESKWRPLVATNSNSCYRWS